MVNTDIILISQSNVIDNKGFDSLPGDRIELFKHLVYPRFVRDGDNYLSGLDYINRRVHGKIYAEAICHERRKLLNIWNLPGMSGIHLSNYLTGCGFKVKVINNFDSEYDLYETYYRQSEVPPLVGISSTFYLGWGQVGALAERVRSITPDAQIVTGGAFVNSQAVSEGYDRFEKVMRKYGINYVLHAMNSETDLRDLLCCRTGEKDFSDLKNFCAIDKNINTGSFYVSPNEWHRPVLNLAEVPANWHLLDLPFLHSTIQIRTSYGCPFECAFCSYPTTAREWTTLDVADIERHLDSLSKIPQVKRIIFTDDTLNVPPKRFKKILSLLSRYDFEWFSFLRVQYIDEEDAKMMRESGCKGVYLGIESANDAVLRNMKKKVTVDHLARGIRLLNKYGIDYLAAFVLGFPGETYASICDNVRFIEENEIKYYSLKEFYYMEHTPIYAARDTYALTGGGNKWRHNTMSHDIASDLKLEMFNEISSAVHIDPDTSLWYMAYLYDQGYSFADISRYQKEINDKIKTQIQPYLRGIEHYKHIC